MTDEQKINDIKHIALKDGIEYCYGMPVPDGIRFYSFGNLLLTNHEMNTYFSKYTKWRDYFECYIPITMPEYYVINDKKIEQFLITKYHTKKIKEKLGKI